MNSALTLEVQGKAVFWLFLDHSQTKVITKSRLMSEIGGVTAITKLEQLS